MAAALLALFFASLASAQTVYIYAQRDTPARSWLPISIELTPAEPIHLRLDWNHHLTRPPIPLLSRVPKTRAEQEMMFLSYIPTNKIHATTVSKSDPRPPAKPELKTRPPQ